MTSDPMETSDTIHDVDRESMKDIKTERDDPAWAGQEGQLLNPAFQPRFNIRYAIDGDVDGCFCPELGVELTQTEKLLIKN